jgi:hypothetical protein
LSDRFIGASWESLPVDLSEERLCQSRCFGTLDDMNNWAPRAKFMIAEGTPTGNIRTMKRIATWPLIT